jgi:hypothetical protein
LGPYLQFGWRALQKCRPPTSSNGQSCSSSSTQHFTIVLVVIKEVAGEEHCPVVVVVGVGVVGILVGVLQ